MATTLLEMSHPSDLADVIDVEKGEICATSYEGAYGFAVRQDDDVDEGWLAGSALTVRLSIRFLNLGTDPIQVVYTTNGTTAVTTTIFTKTNTGKWRWKHITLPAAMLFNHSLFEDYGSSDFYLQCASELCIASVKVARADTDAETSWLAAEQNAEATDGDAVIDGTVPASKFTTSIQSDNFVAGVSGWKIFRDTGNAEFNDMLLRGTVFAVAGEIGGFSIGADYLRDAANTFGLASTVTGGNDVRFWSGASFASRASAPLQIYEDGYIFAKDIVLAKGELSNASGVTGYGYAVGDPLLLLHFDGAKPFETDFYGSVIGHKGQAGVGAFDGVHSRAAFRYGRFNKGVQVAESTTNLITNPSFETNATGWSTFGTWATNARVQDQTRFGTWANQLINNSGASAFFRHSFTATATTSTVSVWIRRNAGTGNVRLYLQQNFAPFGVLGDHFATTTLGEWQRLTVTAATVIGSNYYLGIEAADGHNIHVDGAQAEGKDYVTPYADGSLGDGHAWTGTAHASTSTRGAATLTYPPSGNINLAQGSLSYWVFMPFSVPTTAADFGVYIDSSNSFVVRHASSGLRTPVAVAVSGGSTVSTISGATVAAAGEWHHVVVTWKTGELKLYLDGVKSGETGVYAVPLGTPASIEIGRLNGGVPANTTLDDVCVLAYVLSENEVKSIYYSEAPVMIGISNQEIRLSGAGLGDVFGNANGLFARDAEGNASFGLMNGVVNSNTWGGASESFASGDFMFGSNKAAKSNLFWDASTGQLAWRVETETIAYLDTSGAFVFMGEEDSFNTATLQWKTPAGKQSARVATFFDTVGNISFAAFQAIGTSSGDIGLAELTGINSNENKYNALQVSSNGQIDADMRNSKQTSADAQRFLIQGKSNRTGSRQAILNLQHETSGTAATGFGLGVLFNGHDAGANMREMGRFDFAWSNAGTGARDSYFLVATAEGGTLADRFIVNKQGKLSVGGSNIDPLPTDFFEFNDLDDKQAVIRADASALNDDGWATGAVDYNEYMEQSDRAEKIKSGDIVFVRGGKISKSGRGTALVVSQHGGISGGVTLNWRDKWMPAAAYKKEYGAIPKTIEAWKKRHVKNKARANAVHPPQPFKTNKTLVLNPKWDARKEFMRRDERPEWHPVAFMGQVRVSVRGKVNEGDFIVPSGKGDGFGKAAPHVVEHMLDAVGVAWDNKTTDGAGQILVAVGVH